MTSRAASERGGFADGPFWLGVLAYLVPTFPLAYLWHLVWFHEWYERLQIFRPDVQVPLGFASMLVQAGFFSWAFPRLFRGDRDRWSANAAGCALVFALLAWSFTTLPVAAKFRMESVSTFLWLESSFTALQFLVVAPLLALAHRR